MLNFHDYEEEGKFETVGILTRMCSEIDELSSRKIGISIFGMKRLDSIS